MEQLLIDAFVKEQEAAKAAALVRVGLYLTRPVGIGEHPDILGEVRKAIDTWVQAEERLKAFQTIVNRQDNVSTNTQVHSNPGTSG